MTGLLLLALLGQTPDPSYPLLSAAFEALRRKEYDGAIASFRGAARLAPARPDIRKNLAYALLKTGESEAAREQFGEAMGLDPADLHVALEYAFLCFEAREEAPARKAEARRVFLRVRDAAEAARDEEARATAAQAFRNIDEPLRDGIARWEQALATSPPSFSAHYELAQLAEQRDELLLAVAEYRAAFQLLPERKSVLLELARAEKARGNPEGATAALLAASRGGEPRAAELARERLPDRYPYVYEFRNAVQLDPRNSVLQRELAFLLLRMAESGGAPGEPLRREAEQEFESLVRQVPDDYLAAAQLGLLYLAEHRESEAMPLLKNVLAHADAATANRARMALHLPLTLEDRKPEGDSAAGRAAIDVRVLAERSYNAGFLKDALRYYTQAREENPVDSALALKLGWTNNMLHDDATALRWFDVARHSADSSIAAEAGKAYKTLRPGLQRVRTTLWTYPLYSSRWSDVFGYGQLKTEVHLKRVPVHPYMSVRFVGDISPARLDMNHVYLSEKAFILGVGATTNTWHGAVGWGEMGKAFGYANGRRWSDYRGGVSWSKMWGASLASEHGGGFREVTADTVYLSHFNKNLINVVQNKAGYTVSLGGVKTQTFWMANTTFDARRQYWANFVETGPGFRFHPPGMPASVNVTVSAVRGVYLSNAGNPRRPNFNDFRAGLWYAFTK